MIKETIQVNSFYLLYGTNVWAIVISIPAHCLILHQIPHLRNFPYLDIILYYIIFSKHGDSINPTLDNKITKYGELSYPIPDTLFTK